MITLFERKISMTMAHEGRWALEWAGELMGELALSPEKHEELRGGQVSPQLLQLAHRVLGIARSRGKLKQRPRTAGLFVGGSAKSLRDRFGASIESISRNARKGPEMMTRYTFHDHVSLALHRAAVQMLNEDPSLVATAQATLERWIQRGDPHTLVLWEEWRAILNKSDWMRALAETERGQQLRSASPLPTLLPKAIRLDVLALAQARRDAKK
ncbi:hypothetical protein QTI33_34275 [Variovorax sp. J22P271]|uniref:hypothetical protein n=1 Tax=Variovorax davisae TaxID=3053515 RepID=UPI002576E46A|nr:hypothetical protein [Variovorax sp. J22P271]MDM0037237.1 hypothetical protein [Variovorax sp. J22P271]